MKFLLSIRLEEQGNNFNINDFNFFAKIQALLYLNQEFPRSKNHRNLEYLSHSFLPVRFQKLLESCIMFSPSSQ